MTLLVIVAAVAVSFLVNAWRLDRRAAAKGLKYVPVKEKGRLRNRTRMVLVESDDDGAALAQKLYEEHLAARKARAEHDPYRLLPGGRRRKRRD